MSMSGWFALFGFLAGEAAIVLIIAGSAARFVRPIWQRAIWHTAVVVLLALVFMECCGAGNGVLSVLNSAGSLGAQRTVVRNVPARVGTSTSEIPTTSMLAKPLSGTAAERILWWPGVLWFAGFILFVIRQSASRFGFLLLQRGRRRVVEQALLLRIVALTRRLGLRREIRVTESQSIQGPIAFGIFRQEICLPARFAEIFSPPQQAAMLLHELEHLRAHDPAWYLLTEMMVALWWWHPLVWWARRKLQGATEQAADEASLLIKDGPGVLAECLVQIGKGITEARSFNLLGIEGNGFRSSLGRRVSRLLTLKPEMIEQGAGGWRGRIIYFGGLAVLLLLTVGAASLTSDSEARGPNLAEAIIKLQERQEEKPVIAGPVVAQFAQATPRTGNPGIVSQHNQPQLVIECKIAEVLDDGNPPPWYLYQGSRPREGVQPANRSSTNSNPPVGTGIMTGEQYRSVVKLLEAMPGTDILTPPILTTLSDRQGQFKVVEIRTFVTDMDVKDAKLQPITEQFELGPTVDVIPRVLEDGWSIQVKVLASIREFLGYDKAALKAIQKKFEKFKPAPALPMFRYRVAPNTALVRDGHTLGLGLGLFEVPDPKRPSAKPLRKFRTVFITTTIIDPAGNRVHAEEEPILRDPAVPEPKQKP